MVTALICLVAVLWIPGFYVVANAIRRAPVGFEDADGFHLVEQPATAETGLDAVVSVS